jgi:hypothetical protein
MCVCVCYIRGPSDFWHNFSNRRVGYYSWNFKIKFSIVIKFFHLLSVYNNCKIKIKNKQWKNSLIIFIMTWYNQWPMLFTHVLLSLHFMQILFYLLKINILGYPRQSAGMMTSIFLISILQLYVTWPHHQKEFQRVNILFTVAHLHIGSRSWMVIIILDRSSCT